MINALTVDVEDYFHVSAFENAIDRADWPALDSRVEKNTDELLQLFDDKGVNATFFVLGMVAEQFPNLVRRIKSSGHELACHGYSHRLIYRQSRDEFRRETYRSKSYLEDIIGTAVLGYRAASYSITAESIWALDILGELGFKYDSSIFPINHDRYGISGAETKMHWRKLSSGGRLLEFPLSTCSFGRMRLPVSGGGYFRLFPYAFTRFGLQQVNNTNEPFIFYLHPWEIDPKQPRVQGASLLSRFRHYNNLNKCKSRLCQLLDDFAFDSVESVIKNSSYAHSLV